MLGEVGVVVIGRNEGERLRRCLQSVMPAFPRVVYVDSGSTDGSIEIAYRMGTQVVELDMSIPFCAARARNAGYQRLLEAYPDLRFVQFVDGDCEVIHDWLLLAVGTLEKHDRLAIVAGQLRERAPQVSIYNRLGDVEWNFARVGEVDSVGGIFMIRSDAFQSVGGFDPSIAAGEEPELCQRLSRQGWRFLRLGQDMALHDLAMTQFRQWWKRQARFGYGSLDVATRFGLARFRRANLRARFWLAWLIVTVSAVTASALGHAAMTLPAFILLSLWFLQLGRITFRLWRDAQSFELSFAYAFFLMISFLPQMTGQSLYLNDQLRKRPLRLIEHKAGRVPMHSDDT